MNINELREITHNAAQKISDEFSKHPVCKHINNAILNAAKSGKYTICLNFNECLKLCGCSDFPLNDAHTYFTLHGFNFQTRNAAANSHMYIAIDWA